MAKLDALIQLLAPILSGVWGLLALMLLIAFVIRVIGSNRWASSDVRQRKNVFRQDLLLAYLANRLPNRSDDVASRSG